MNPNSDADELPTVEEGLREATGPSVWSDGPAPNNAGGQESLVRVETETTLEKETEREIDYDLSRGGRLFIIQRPNKIFPTVHVSLISPSHPQNMLKFLSKFTIGGIKINLPMKLF